MRKNNNKNVPVGIFFLILSIITIYFAFSQQTELNKQQQKTTQEIKEVKQTIKKSEKKSSDYPDFDSLSQLNKVTIVSNLTSWTPSSNLNDDKVKKVLILEKGQLAKAYVYIKTSLDNKPLTQWESVYLTMNWVGGHLFRPQSLPIPPSNKTELLYAINYIPYLNILPYNEQNTPLIADWFPYFIDGNRIEIYTFISSLRPALLDEITIYYQCVENSDCLLTVH